MRKLIAGMTAVILTVILAFPCNALSAESAILLDADTGRVLYEKNASKRGLIASTTKIMTALVVCEHCNVLDRFRIPKEAVGIEGSSMYLQEGEVLTIQDLLYGLMLHSGNDAAVALAIYCAGTVEGFTQLMNDKAARLGLDNTNFENPHGLDGVAHYSTAEDLAKLASYAMSNPIFRKTVSTKTVSAGKRHLRNHNKLLWRYEGANGVKTGYTKKAGRILVSGAERNGRQLIAVTMNAPNDWQDHEKLLNQGFSEFTTVQIVNEGDCLGYLEVAGGTQPRVSVLASDDFCFPLAQDEIPRIILQEPGFVYAPIQENDDAGLAYIMLGDYVAGTVPIVYSDDVNLAAEEKISFFQRLFGG